MEPFISYFTENYDVILSLLLEHIRMTSVAVTVALAIGVPLGILISFYKDTSPYVLGVANLLQAIPQMALLGLFIPIMGIGVLPATVVVILYSLLPIIRNTYTGITSIDAGKIEAARGIGQHLTDDVMRNLNYKVDEEGQDLRDVAPDFLVEEGLIKE